MTLGRSSNESFGGGTSAPGNPETNRGRVGSTDPLRQVRTIL